MNAAIRAMATATTVALCMTCWFTLDVRAQEPESVEPHPDDAEFVEQFVAEFPQEEYEIHNVEGVGKFFLRKKGTAPPGTPVDLVKDTIRRGEVWEAHVHLAMEALAEPDTVAIDVGAHIGAHTVPMAKLVGSRGKVYAFEPQLERYRHLRKNLELNGCDNVVALRYAVGDKHDVIEIAGEQVQGVGSGGEQVELRTIDSFELANVSLLKIDVEGFEDYVIAGAAKTIRDNRPLVIVEIQGGTTLESASPQQRQQIEHTIETLKDFDYEVINIGGHDYLALPQEREAEVTRKLNQAVPAGEDQIDKTLLVALAALMGAAVVLGGILLWRSRYA